MIFKSLLTTLKPNLMKTKLILLSILTFISVNAQITNLHKLSKGVFYDSDVIKDANNNIKGYFLLFETDKVAKETVELEYVILDENLTKVTNGFITEMKFESFLIDAKKINIEVTLYKNILLLRLSDDFGGPQGFIRYRTLDLTTNKLSNNFLFNKDVFNFNPTFDRKLKNYENNASENVSYYKEIGIVVNKISEYKNENSDENYLAHYDDNYNLLWKYNYVANTSRRDFKICNYLNSDKDIIVFQNQFYEKYLTINKKSITVLDAKKGKFINEVLLPELDLYSYRIINCIIKGNEIQIVGNYSKKIKAGYVEDLENIGIFNFNFDKTTGKIISTNYLKWENANSKIEINKKGLVKDEGYLYIHDIIPLKNDKLIAVCETYYQSPVVTNNIYFLELSKDFKINQVFEVEKFRNKFPKTNLYSSSIKEYGMFDFMDYQNMGDDEFLFYFNDNEKNSKNRKNSTLFGVVSYVDGKFQKQILNLKTETSTIKAYPAKKGYLMLVEDFDTKDKPNEFRLEKINY